ncbi:hypothetical protein C0993_003306 [Termitomyces sp. T159_Od127]|nr:hypothetical protein C0993_003306 [Termitomyces sp. T159_Od127]
MSAHVFACRSVFSFNYSLGVGRTDGEAPERGWVEINPLASSTKEMEKGSQRDALDCHFGDYDWRKVNSMGRTLLRKFKAMTVDMSDHFIAHFELNTSLPRDLLLKWEAEIEAWEQDKTQPDPFTLKMASLCCYELAQAEAQNAGTLEEASLDDHVSPSVLIACSLEIEGEQYVDVIICVLDLMFDAKTWSQSRSIKDMGP